MRDLRVTLVQGMLHWEDGAANRAMFEEFLKGRKGSTDLVVLPEMFSTGFSMRSEQLAEPMNGPTLEWMKTCAARMESAIYGSVIIVDEGRYFNRGVFVQPGGEVTVYDKRHLFRMADEAEHYTAGRERVVVEWRGWRFLLQVCYDLRFPVFSRAKVVQGVPDFDAILYVANWPEARRYPWRQLLIARAIENQAYVIGVNRVGMDGKGIHYAGDSAVVDPRGEVTEAPPGVGCSEYTLHGDALVAFRQKFPVHLDADDFDLKG